MIGKETRFTTALEAPMVKSESFGELRFFGGFAAILGMSSAIAVAVMRGGDFGSIAGSLAMALGGAALFWGLLPWAPVEKRRQAAARQEPMGVTLAAEQPMPDE